ncbi:MAG: helix-turn-helix domain-containing protein [Balneola sp.]
MQIDQKILQRVKEAYSLATDTALADFLGVQQSTVATWKRRDSYNLELIISKCNELNLNWLLYGELPMWKEDLGSKIINEPSSDYVTQQLISFEAKTAALIERIENGPWSPEIKLKMVESMIRIVEQTLDHGDKENQT